MRKILLLFITIVLMSCNESADSLRSKACKCYKKAQNLENSDAMFAKLRSCDALTRDAIKALNEQAMAEDWSYEKEHQKQEELDKKYDCSK